MWARLRYCFSKKKYQADALSKKRANSSPTILSSRKRPSTGGQSWGPRKNHDTTTPASLDTDFSTGFGAPDSGVSWEQWKKLTGTDTLGSHSALFDRDGHKETEADHSSSKAKTTAAHSAENYTASRSAVPAYPVAASSGGAGGRVAKSWSSGLSVNDGDRDAKSWSSGLSVNDGDRDAKSWSSGLSVNDGDRDAWDSTD